MAQPRDPSTGKFVCVPTYPRKRTSTCGCGGGGSHPCPVAQRFRHIRQAALRAFSRPSFTPADLDDVERELYVTEQEREALVPALDYVRAQLRDAAGSAAQYHRAQGPTHERPIHSRRGGVNAGGSQQAYEDLLAERQSLLAHDRHLGARLKSLEAERHRIEAFLRKRGRLAPGYARLRAAWVRSRRGPVRRSPAMVTGHTRRARAAWR